MKWAHVVTRNYHLLQTFYTYFAYQKIPLRSLKDNLTISKNGTIKRYLNADELEQFYSFIKKNKNSLKKEFKKVLEIDSELCEIIKGDPIKNFKTFHEKYLKYWSYSLLGHYVGFALSHEQIKPFEKEVYFLRGEKAVMNKIEDEYFSKLFKELEKKTNISSSLLSFAFPEEIMKNEFNVKELKKRKKNFVWVYKDGKSTFYTGKEAEEVENRELKQIEGLPDISKHNWKHLAYRNMPLVKSHGMFMSNFNKELYREKLGVPAWINNCIIILGDWYMEKDFEQFEENISRFLNEDQKRYFKFLENGYRDSEKMLELSKKVNDWKSLKEFMEHADNFTPFILIIYGGDQATEEKLKKMVDEKDYKTISTPVKENITLVEKRELLEIIAGGGSEEEIKKHFNDYLWISTAGYYQKAWTWKDFKKRVEKLRKENPEKTLKNYLEKRKKLKEDFEKILKKADKEKTEFFKIVNEYIFFRTYRTDAYHEASHIVMKYINKVGSELGFKENDLLQLTLKDLIKVVKGELSEKELQDYRKITAERAKGYAIVSVDKEITILSGKEVEELKKILVEDYSKITELKGTPANKGVVKGRVKIVKNTEDVRNIKEGDILVAAMTHPRYIIAMEKAAAFVTEEGGITCHAAIVSREMNKPCIIGTKIATKVFKDGDLVEVDADNGIVRKIK